MFNFTVCQLEISTFFCAALSDGSLPWSGDEACATCSASSGRTATPYSPISTMSWIGACAEGDDDDPLLSSSLQMIWRQTACSTIAWLAGLECTGSQRPQFHPTLTEVQLDDEDPTLASIASTCAPQPRQPLKWGGLMSSSTCSAVCVTHLKLYPA